MSEVGFHVAEHFLKSSVVRNIVLAHHHVESIPENQVVIRVNHWAGMPEIRVSRFESIWKSILPFVFNTTLMTCSGKAVELTYTYAGRVRRV